MKEYTERSFVGDLFFNILINSLAGTCSLNLQTKESSESSKITMEHESNISSYCGAAFHSRPCPVQPMEHTTLALLTSCCSGSCLHPVHTKHQGRHGLIEENVKGRHMNKGLMSRDRKGWDAIA